MNSAENNVSGGTPDILVVTTSYSNRHGVLRPSLESMLHRPGMPFRLWVEDSNSAFVSESGIHCEQNNLLLDLYNRGKIDKLILSNQNTGHSHPLNLMMAMA